MKKILVVLFSLVTTTAFAAHSKSTAKASAEDKAFAVELAEGNATEIAAARVCMERCESADAREFGRMMVEDHTAAGKKFGTLVASKHITLPVLKTPFRLEVMLSATAPADFDVEYMGQMVAGHQKVVVLLGKEASLGKDADLRKFASELLPTVLHHQAEAERISAKLATR
jgi:putative membrane protein